MFSMSFLELCDDPFEEARCPRDIESGHATELGVGPCAGGCGSTVRVGSLLVELGELSQQQILSLVKGL